MTDTLRDRIARVLYRCDYDLRDWEKATDVGKQPYYDDADAVIEALKLHVVTVGYFQTVIKGSYPKPLEDK